GEVCGGGGVGGGAGFRAAEVEGGLRAVDGRQAGQVVVDGDAGQRGVAGVGDQVAVADRLPGRREGARAHALVNGYRRRRHGGDRRGGRAGGYRRAGRGGAGPPAGVGGGA